MVKKINKISIHKKTKKGTYLCANCRKEYSKNGIGSHYFLNHGKGKKFRPLDKYRKTIDSVWNKGLDISHPSIKKQSDTLKRKYKDGTITTHLKGKSHPNSTKKKISKSMKRAHKENRAWNIGKSRWNNKSSYPELFFSKVIKNHFSNQKYTREYPLSRYSLDFAWVDLKKCIEIDGEQHLRFKE